MFSATNKRGGCKSKLTLVICDKYQKEGDGSTEAADAIVDS